MIRHRIRHSGKTVFGVLQYTVKTGKIIVARYSGETVLEGFTVFIVKIAIFMEIMLVAFQTRVVFGNANYKP